MEIFTYDGIDYKIIDTVNDGNCCYDAIAKTRYSDHPDVQNYHLSIRADVTEYIFDHFDNYLPFLLALDVTTEEEYLTEYGNVGCFVGDLELGAYCEMEGVRLIVYYQDRNWPPRTYGTNSGQIYRLLFNGPIESGHFRGLIPLPPNSDSKGYKRRHKGNNDGSQNKKKKNRQRRKSRSKKKSEKTRRLSQSNVDKRFQQLELESQRLKDVIQKAKEEKDALIAAAYPMSERCSLLMGSLLSKYICHITNNNEHIVIYIINVKHTKEFLTIVHSVLRCFLIKYSDELHTECCEEMSFVMSILGIIVNISKFQYGRDFLATNEFAQGLLVEFINYLPALPIPSGNGLKRSLLCLFNTYSRPGPTSSHGWNELLHAFRHSLLRDRDGTFHFYYLSIVLNMLQSLPAKEFTEDLTRIVPMVQLHELVTSDARGVAVLAQNVISGIHAQQSRVGAESSTAGGRPVFCVPPEDLYCYGIPATTCPSLANPAGKSGKQCCFS